MCNQPDVERLDRFDLLILDDIGYVKKSEQETSVLFELIAHRYEYRSLLITANQPFGDWDTLFPDKIMAVAAIDRVVHHATIIKVDGESYSNNGVASCRATPSSLLFFPVTPLLCPWRTTIVRSNSSAPI